MSDVLMKRSSICGAGLAPRPWNENWELDWYVAQEIGKWNEVKYTWRVNSYSLS